MRAILVCLLVVCVSTATDAQIFDQDPTTGHELVVRDLEAEGWVSVIVKLNMPAYRAEGHLRGRDERQRQRSAIRSRQTKLIERLDGTHVRVMRRFNLLPYVVLEVTRAGLNALTRDPAVSLITADIVGEPAADGSLPISTQGKSAEASAVLTADARLVVGADIANANGCDGKGWAIAILDSGIQNDHLSVAGRVVHEACFSTHSPSLNQESLCPNFASDTTGTGVGDDCTPCRGRTGSAPNYTYQPADCHFWPPGQFACPHGTLITGPAAANGGGIVGIAPEVDIISIKVMTRYIECSSPWDRGCPKVNASDLMAGIEHVAAMADSINIAALNISIDMTSPPGAPGSQTSPCDGIAALSGIKEAIDLTNSYGIPTTAATGNNDQRNRLNPPSCLSNTISVGYTQDGSSYSGNTTKVDSIGHEPNRAYFLDFWTPGEWITSGWPHDPLETTRTTRGTSLASPQVAAAFAALRSKGGTRGIDYYRTLLDSTGVMVTDNKISNPPKPLEPTGITKPRIDVGAACLAMSVVELDAKVLLEGPYIGSGMMSTGSILQDSLPTLQPFGEAEYLGTVLEYSSLDAVPSLAPEVVDWLLVSIRTGTDASTTVDEQPALLLTDGSIRDFDGINPVRFLGPDSTSYYVVVRHRNHGDVMTSTAIDFSSGSGSWDFTTAMSQAHSIFSNPMTLLDTRYGMFGGDIDIDAQVTAGDFNVWLAQTKATETGYRSGDITLDGQVTASDFNIWLVNTKAVMSSQVP
jgi:hypothetical protein